MASSSRQSEIDDTKLVSKHSKCNKHRHPIPKEVLVVVEAINKIGVAVEEFFTLVVHAVQVPTWFKPEREAERFARVRAAARSKKPEGIMNYQVPPCILSFAKMIQAMAKAKALEFFNRLQAQAISMSNSASASVAA